MREADEGGLVGRDRQIAELSTLLRDHAAVCVHGPLGIGKTALARVVVERESRAGVIARPRASSVRSVFAAGPS